MNVREMAKRTMRSAQLAALLEVSGYPKPGNVHRTADLPNLRYEHFLAGSIAMGETIREVTLKGAKAGEGKIEPSEIAIGKGIEQAVHSVMESHKGGNSHLGMILLFVPLSAAAGWTYAEDGQIETEALRKNVGRVMRSTTSADSVQVHDAILIGREGKGENEKVSRSSWLGQVGTGAPSIRGEEAREKLLEENISLWDWMKSSSSWDSISRELTSGMETSFEVGYPSLVGTFEAHEDINVAIVHTFLRILSKYPDTFVARKVGLKETSDIADAVRIGLKRTRWISDRAGSILEAGGLTTEEGKRKLRELDEALREKRGELNPGTTADLTAASLMIAILCGLKF